MTANVYERFIVNEPRPDSPFTPELRVVRGREQPVVVDQRTDRAELLCESWEDAEARAKQLNEGVEQG